MKPNYIFIYKNEYKLGELLKYYPFNDTIIESKTNKDEGIIEYEHFTLKFFRKSNISQNLRGYKAWGVIVDNDLLKDADFEAISMLNHTVYVCGAIGFVKGI